MKRDIVDVTVEDNRAAVHSRLKVRFVPKDIAFTSDVLDAFRFEDWKDYRAGRIYGYCSYQERSESLGEHIAAFVFRLPAIPDIVWLRPDGAKTIGPSWASHRGELFGSKVQR
jgi:hypothetical protein